MAGLTFPNRIRNHFAVVPATSRTNGAASLAATRSIDADLKSKVKRHLETFADYLSDVLRIEIDGDTVIVSGTVESDDDRQLVMRIISNIREALSIRDQMDVSYFGRGSRRDQEPQALWTSILGCWGQQP